jgi:dTMP kinase
VSELRFMGIRPPGVEDVAVPGRLVVVEATDGVGRSTQVRLLKEWLEDQGYAVLDTGLRRSDLAGPGIERAKEGHTLDPITLNLFYATDFWDRLERQILPALRAGMVVIADRYVFSLIARAVVRGVELGWLENLYAFAVVPDCVIYLDVDVQNLLSRILRSSGFDYWESGQDYLRGQDLYHNFVRYQEMLLAEFRQLADRYGFQLVDARGSIADTFRSMRQIIQGVVRTMGSDEGAVPIAQPSGAQASERLGREQPAEGS